MKKHYPIIPILIMIREGYGNLTLHMPKLVMVPNHSSTH